MGEARSKYWANPLRIKTLDFVAVIHVSQNSGPNSQGTLDPFVSRKMMPISALWICSIFV